MGVTLRRRIFWWSVGSTLVILLVAFLFVDEAFRTTILRDQHETLIARAHLAAQLQESEIEQSLEYTVSLARTPTLRAAVETADSLTIRQNLELLVGDSGLDWLAFITADGELLASTSSAPARVAGGETAPLVEEARFYDTGDLWREGVRLVQVHATGVFMGQHQLGVLLSGAPIGQERVARLEGAIQQRVAFISDGGVVAAGGDLTDTEVEDLLRTWGPMMVEAPDADSIQVAGTGTVREFPLGGDQNLGTAISLPDLRGRYVGSLVTFRSLEEALAPARRLRLALLAIALGGIMLALASSYLLSRRVTLPVNRLLRETVRLGSGNLDQPIRPERNDEIGALAAGFEQMRVSLRETREELVRAERLSAVGRAASAIVHDIRQPVTAIQGHVGLLKMEGDDPVQREEDLSIIERELARLNSMMSELLEFGRGGESVDSTDGLVSDLLEEVTTGVRPLLASKEIELHVENSYPGEWKFDFQGMRRVLENLVRNAAAIVGPGGTVWLRSGATRDGLRLEIEDTGPGIPKEIRDTLFEPFVTFGKKEGTGLGLAIVKAFTERNGGTVRFETSSRGTRFILDFQREDRA